MKITKLFKLGVSQHEVDFVDIDPTRDKALFLDPHFLAHRDDHFSLDASATIRNFFSYFLELVRDGDYASARQMFSYMHEPNETCLGLSKGKPRGNAVSEALADALFESLKTSKAVTTGLVEHVEDIRLFIPGIDKDKVSDMVTNIVRKQLIEYTREQCIFWDIPLTPNQDSGFFWDRVKHNWISEYGDALVYRGQRLLLVPKGVVSYSKAYTSSRIHRYAVLPYLQHEHLRIHSLLVQTTNPKKGPKKEFVTKQSLIDAGEAPSDKDFISDFVHRHTKIFEDFKVAEARKAGLSLPAADFDSLNSIQDVALTLIRKLEGIPDGKNDADRFHKCVVGILELIFYPDLICPSIETKINDGRKRIDITFENAANDGFFRRLHMSQNIPCPYVSIECKNYSSDPSNPEVDQLYGRLSLNRGKLGLLICRHVDNQDLLLKRCRDIYRDNGSLLIPLWDVDLVSMLSEVNEVGDRPYEILITERAKSVRMG
jgi:hypothetical protein